ncbi:MAG: membrane protein insertase YidC [Acidiferrobacterales bacterium]
MDNQRQILLIALGVILLLLWFSWEDAQRARSPVAQAPVVEQQAFGGNAPVAPSTPTVTSGQTSAPQLNAPAQRQITSGKRVHVITDLLDVQIDTFGGDLRYLGLRQYPKELNDKDLPFPLMNDSGEEVLIAQSGLFGLGKHYPFHRTQFTSSQSRYTLRDGEDTLSVDLRWRAKDGVRYTKRYTFKRDSYVVRLDFIVDNRSRATWQGYLYGQFLKRPVNQEIGFMALPTFDGGVIYTTEEAYEKVDYDELSEKLDRPVTGGWAAMMQHYFIASWLPDAKQKGQIYSSSPSQDRYVIGYKHTEPLTIAPGNKASVGIDIYAGPKEPARLKNLPQGMDLTVDFGWLTFISAPLYALLSYIQSFVGNWGWAIIVLTIMIKAVFFPLNNTQYKSMAKMKKLQPRMAALKEQHGGDRERYSKAMMELYKKEKVNPMSGCLPILVQIPVFIALYWVLLESVEMRQAPFMLWIHDLSAKDPYFILPLLMGASMFVTTWMSPTTDPMQRKIFLMMPVMFTAFFLFFPSGLVLYWLVNNVLQIIQQTYINRSIAASSK